MEKKRQSIAADMLHSLTLKGLTTGEKLATYNLTLAIVAVMLVATSDNMKAMVIAAAWLAIAAAIFKAKKVNLDKIEIMREED